MSAALGGQPAAALLLQNTNRGLLAKVLPMMLLQQEMSVVHLMVLLGHATA
jgi:hypothetical protein